MIFHIILYIRTSTSICPWTKHLTLLFLSHVCSVADKYSTSSNIYGKYEIWRDKDSLSLISGKWKMGHHLVFWLLETLIGLRNRVRGLVGLRGSAGGSVGFGGGNGGRYWLLVTEEEKLQRREARRSRWLFCH